MAAERFNRVRIDEIWLSRDGSEPSIGQGCKLTVSNLDLLMMDKTGSTDINADGSQFRHLVDVHGVDLAITVTKLLKPVFDDLKTFCNTANNTGASFEVEITGRTGNFLVSAKVHPKNPISAGSFVNDWIRDVVIRLVTD